MGEKEMHARQAQLPAGRIKITDTSTGYLPYLRDTLQITLCNYQSGQIYSPDGKFIILVVALL